MKSPNSASLGWRALFPVLMLATFGLPPTLLQAKSYTLQRVEIRAEILPDGSLRIEEARTYRFRDRFRWADYRLPLDPTKLGTVKDFSLREGESLYQPTSDEEPGTYQLQLSDDELYVKWFYRARNETRTFVLSYLVTDAVTVHADVAEFYYKFVGEANQKRIETVLVTIRLPEAADTTQVRAWAHGPLWGELRFTAGALQMDISPLPAEKYWEARVLFPTEWVPAATRRRTGEMLSSIMEAEAAWARQANLERARELERLREKEAKEQQAIPIAGTFALAGLLAWAALYLKFGRGFDVPYHQRVDPAIPENTPPAKASIIYNNNTVNSSALMAVLLDLARKGWLTIEEVPQPQKRSWFSSNEPDFLLRAKSRTQDRTQLADYERDLLAFLFDELAADEDSVSLKTLKKSSTKVQKWFKTWQKKVEGHYKEPLWDKQSIKATVIAAVAAGLVIVAGIVILITLGEPGAIALAAGGILLLLSFAILRYTPQVKLLRKRLESLRRYLQKHHFQRQGSGGLINRLEEYLIYGVALGVGAKAIKAMLESIPAGHLSHHVPWYVWASGNGSPSDFAGAISSFVSVAGSSMSSATGTGGGASAGGGGGGGGASGGAG